VGLRTPPANKMPTLKRSIGRTEITALQPTQDTPVRLRPRSRKTAFSTTSTTTFSAVQSRRTSADWRWIPERSGPRGEHPLTLHRRPFFEVAEPLDLQGLPFGVSRRKLKAKKPKVTVAR
jgi:hypothetical protein